MRLVHELLLWGQQRLSSLGEGDAVLGGDCWVGWELSLGYPENIPAAGHRPSEGQGHPVHTAEPEMSRESSTADALSRHRAKDGKMG